MPDPFRDNLAGPVIDALNVKVSVHSAGLDARKAASYSNNLFDRGVQSVQGLPCVNEIMALDKEFFVLQPVYRVPDGSRRKQGLTDEILLRELPSCFQYFVHELCRWGQVPDLSSCVFRYVGVYNKNDPS